ncbi:MAG: hypothetical protein ABSG30_04625 [Steroidobacteraceae bacterium]
MRVSDSRQVVGMPDHLWWQRREAALNWIAFGLLLAAWNVADDAQPAPRRPEALRGYSQVSVRAVERNSAMNLAADPSVLVARR